MTTITGALFRPKLSLLNGVSALAGYLLFPTRVEAVTAFSAVLGVTLLASAGSALNQVLERDLDARMRRTTMRPLPSRAITPQLAIAIGAATMSGGLLLLFAAGGLTTVLLGCAALLWYLLVYTPLKTRTALALPIGALCGIFPPLIGWELAGGHLADYRIITLAGLLFLCQAGIPLFGAVGTENRAYFGIWLMAFCAAAMLLPAFGLILRPGALWFALFPLPLLVLFVFRSGALLFPYINSFPLLLTLLLILQRFY